MKVMLVLPPSHSAISSVLGTTGPPLGLAYIASVLEREGHDVRIIDSLALNYSLKDLRSEVKSFDPDVVGLTATTPAIYDAYKVAKLVKLTNPNAKVVIGGPHVTFTAEETLRECPYIDVVVRGEGEMVMSSLIKNLEKGRPLKEVKGVTYRHGQDIRSTQDAPLIRDLNELPLPAYHLLPMERYRVGGKRFGTVITSRGCPFQCIFCSSSQLYGKFWRARSPENVLEELRVLRDKYGIREVEFLDDTFTLNNKRAERICELIKIEGLDISWSCSSRADTLARRLALKLKSAGCHFLYLGVESGSQKLLNIIRKGITLEQAKNAIRVAKHAGLNTLASFMLGIPGETKETIKKTINFAKRLNPTLAQFTLCTPYPGTRLYEIAKRCGYLLTKDWSKYTTLEPVIKLPGITVKELKRWLEKAYLSFYLRPNFIIRSFGKNSLFFMKRIIEAVINYVGLRGVR